MDDPLSELGFLESLDAAIAHQQTAILETTEG